MTAPLSAPPPSLRYAVISAILCSLGAAFYSSAPVEPLPIVAFVLTVGPLFAVISWLQKDARRTGVGAVHDLGFFLWLAWPVVIPWYVWRTRGLGGWKLLIALFACIVSAYAVAIIVYGLVHGSDY
jgi:hypothetical protein